jgi:hypothetical protein
MALTDPSYLTPVYRYAFGFRPAYNGDLLNAANRPHAVPASQNCALWLTQLPAGTTAVDIEAGLLALARRGPSVGSIWALSINAADPARGLPDAAASLALTRVADARRLWDRAGGPRGPGLIVRGRRVRAAWNRNRVGPRAEGAVQSRVLVITGPRAVISEAVLREFFERTFKFETTGVEVLGGGEEGGKGENRAKAQGENRDMVERREFEKGDAETKGGEEAEPGADGETVEERKVGPKADSKWAAIGHTVREDYVTLIWRFASARGQSCIAAACLGALRDEHGVDVRFSYGVDPCEVDNWRPGV